MAELSQLQGQLFFAKDIYTIETAVKQMIKGRDKLLRCRAGSFRITRLCKTLTIALVLFSGLFGSITKAQERSTKQIKITQKERVAGIDAPVLSGTILDPNRAVIAGARIVLSDATSKESLETRSDDEGHFKFADVPLGDYLLTIYSPGFITYKTSKLSLLKDHVTQIEVTLLVANESVPINVVGKIPD